MAKIAAVVTLNRADVSGGAPIFYAADKDELERTAMLLEKMLDCAAHQLNEHLFVIVDHHAENG
jgi:HD superfamily phosphohydrolase YqeK